MYACSCRIIKINGIRGEYWCLLPATLYAKLCFYLYFLVFVVIIVIVVCTAFATILQGKKQKKKKNIRKKYYEFMNVAAAKIT